jgi:hypothetical protein
MVCFWFVSAVLIKLSQWLNPYSMDYIENMYYLWLPVFMAFLSIFLVWFWMQWRRKQDSAILEEVNLYICSYSFATNARVNSWSNHPPPGTPPGIFPIDSSRGSGICLSYMCTGAGYWRTPGIWQMLPRIPPTNFKAAKPSFRHACGRWSYFVPSWSRWREIYCKNKNHTLCHANLNTTIKGLCFIIFHSSLIVNTIMLLNYFDYMPLKV